MSKYTTELRFIVDSNYDLGLKDYPIFDENYRKQLNDKIIEHYYFREIGLETVGLFKRFLNRKMNEIMSYYNQLYKSELLKFDPMVTKKLVDSYVKDSVGSASQAGEGTQNAHSSATSNDKSILSDTPQGLLSMGNIDTNLYASSASIDTAQGENNTDTTTQSTATTASENKEDFTRTIQGAEGDQSLLLKSFRETFLNIDMMVIADLNDLFMGIW